MNKEINDMIWLVDKAKELGFEPILLANQEFCDALPKAEITKSDRESGYISKCSGVPLYVDDNASEPKVMVEFDIDLYYSL